MESFRRSFGIYFVCLMRQLVPISTQVMGKTLRFASQIDVPNVCTCKLKACAKSMNHITWCVWWNLDHHNVLLKCEAQETWLYLSHCWPLQSFIYVRFMQMLAVLSQLLPVAQCSLWRVSVRGVKMRLLSVVTLRVSIHLWTEVSTYRNWQEVFMKGYIDL
jgi:hypothetical protein